MNRNLLPMNWFSNETQIGNPGAAWWMTAAIFIGFSVLLAAWFRRRARARFATAERLDDFFRRSSFFGLHPVVAAFTSASIATVSVALLAIALMDVRWGKTEQEIPQTGIEILFLLDVSRSMLAEDVAPNRLQRAKQMIRDMVGRMAGDRVGLVVFAGESRQTIPLTNHYEDFNQMLDEVGPGSVRRGGSRLGDAIDAADRAFLNKTSAQRVVVVLTDGEDQESEPVKVAKRMHDELKTRIFTIGLGDMNSGARIPDVDLQRPDHESGRYVKYRGEAVWSKMNGEILREIAQVTDGIYIPAGTKQVDMAEVYDRYIAGMETTEFASAKVDSYVARFQWFALPALVLLLIDFAGRLSWRRATTVAGKRMSSVAVFVIATTFVSPVMAAASSVASIEAHNRGVELYRQGEFEPAAAEFARAANSPDNSVAVAARYNLGTTLYASAVQTLQSSEDEPTASPTASPTSSPMEQAKQSLNGAITAFRSALRVDPQQNDARANLEKSIRLLEQIEQQEEQQNQEQQDQPNEQDPSEESEQQDSEEGESEEGESQEGDSTQQNSEQQESESPDSGEEGTEPDSQPSDPSNEPMGQPDPQSDAGSDSESESESEKPSGADDNEEPPPDDASGELSSESDDSVSESNDEPNSMTEAMNEQPPLGESMTAEEAMKMLQSIRDRDMIRRFRLQQLRQKRQIPVDKDW